MHIELRAAYGAIKSERPVSILLEGAGLKHCVPFLAPSYWDITLINKRAAPNPYHEG